MPRQGSIKEQVYPEAVFGGLSHFDGGVRYYSRVQALVSSQSVVLDYGCGRGAHTQDSNPFYRNFCSFKGKVKRVIGVDLTDAGLRNPELDEFRQMKDESIPLENETVDLCHADWVIEHIENIDAAFREVRRVLKPGGYFCFRTPNRFHYSSIGASMIPFAFHHKLRQLLGHPHEAEDVFATTYPCNAAGKARRLFRKHGFESLVYYHRSDSLLMGLGYWPGLFGRLIEAVSPPFLWHEIHAFGRKLA